MKLSELPAGWVVAVDTEGSGLRVEPPNNDRVSVVSWAYRDPDDGHISCSAATFDQGAFAHQWRLAPKPLPSSHRKRCDRWDDWAKAERIPNQPPSVFYQLLEVLSAHRLVFHNAKHDLKALRAGLRGFLGSDFVGNFYWDTMLAQALLQPQFPIALKEVTRREFIDGGQEDDEKEALAPWLGPSTDPRYDLVPWKVIKSYAIKDARLALLLYEWQLDRINPSLQHKVDFDFEFMRVLYGMETRGIGFDAELARQQAALLRAEKKEVALSLPFRATGPGARKFFFEEQGHKHYPDKMTDGGQPQVDEEVVARLVDEGVPHARNFAHHESVKSALAKWYEPWPAATSEDGRLRTNHNQSSTVGGRLSVNQVQLHAIPHSYLLPDLEGLVPVMELFVPKPDHELWNIDVSQAEIRVGTAIAGCEAMLDGFRVGWDAHSAATRQMFGIEPEDRDWDELRQVAKRINLSIQYGAGAPTIRALIKKFTGRDYPLKQVREWVAIWKDTYPEMVWAMEREQSFAEQNSCVRLMDGRVRFFRDYEAKALYKAFNAKAQFTVARVMAQVMVDWERLYPETLLLQVHDSIVLELSTDRVEPLVQAAKNMVVRKFERFCARSWAKGRPQTIVPFKADASRFNHR